MKQLRRNPLKLGLEEERWMFHFLHSLSVTSWSAVELVLARLVLRGAPSSFANSLFPAFIGLESFRSKIDFADRYVRAKAAEDAALVKEWSAIYEIVCTCSQERNLLAHWGLVVYEPGEIGERIALLPAVIKSGTKIERQASQHRDLFEAPGYAIHLRRLAEIRNGIDHVAVCVSRFAAKLHGAPDPMPTHPGRAQGPTLRAVVNELRELNTRAT